MMGDTRTARANHEYVWTVEECASNGGHCYSDEGRGGIVIDTYPPTYHRTCKHCGMTQHGHPQPAMEWTDSD